MAYLAYHISTQNESKLKIAQQSYKSVKFIKSCSKLQKLPFKTKVAHKTKCCQNVAEQLEETPTQGCLFVYISHVNASGRVTLASESCFIRPSRSYCDWWTNKEGVARLYI